VVNDYLRPEVGKSFCKIEVLGEKTVNKRCREGGTTKILLYTFWGNEGGPGGYKTQKQDLGEKISKNKRKTKNNSKEKDEYTSSAP